MQRILILCSVLLAINTANIEDKSKAIHDKLEWREQAKIEATEKLEERQIEVPEYIIELTNEAGEMYGICPELLQAIAFKESSFRVDATNGDCIGLMQVNKMHGDNLYDARTNIFTATEYLAELFEKYGDVLLVLNAYNGRSDLYCESDYVKDVLEISQELERIHDK